MQHDAHSATSSSRWSTVLGWLAVLVEIAAVVAQLVMIYLLHDSRYHIGCGEQCAWAGMGLVALLSAMLPLMLVGTIVALFMLARTSRAYRMRGASRAPYVLHAAVAALPLAVFGALVLSDRPLSKEPPKVAATPVETHDDQFVAGAAYATDEGIMDAAGCAGHSTSFVSGCTRIAERQRRATSPSGATIRATPNP